MGSGWRSQPEPMRITGHNPTESLAPRPSRSVPTIAHPSWEPIVKRDTPSAPTEERIEGRNGVPKISGHASDRNRQDVSVARGMHIHGAPVLHCEFVAGVEYNLATELAHESPVREVRQMLDEPEPVGVVPPG